MFWMGQRVTLSMLQDAELTLELLQRGLAYALY